MTEELDKKLVEKYPLIFANRYKDETESAMCWGFSHGDGWYWLLDTMCNHIQSYIDNNKHLNVPQVVATQCKEKFGTLRFYFYGGDDYIRGIVSHTEFLSGRVCEVCGTLDDIGTTHGWLITLCKSHWIESNKKFWTDNNNVTWEKLPDGTVGVTNER